MGPRHYGEGRLTAQDVRLQLLARSLRRCHGLSVALGQFARKGFLQEGLAQVSNVGEFGAVVVN